MAFTVVYDACVLHPASVRDLLIRLARTKIFRAGWTEDIETELARSLAHKDKPMPVAQAARLIEHMRQAVPDALIEGHRPLVDALRLPDPDDRHVLAAAIKAGAQVIVTYNMKDFPREAMAPWGIEVQHPDEFVSHVLDLNEAAVAEAVKEQRAALANPPFTVDELLAAFQRNQLTATVVRLRAMGGLL